MPMVQPQEPEIKSQESLEDSQTEKQDTQQTSKVEPQAQSTDVVDEKDRIIAASIRSIQELKKELSELKAQIDESRKVREPQVSPEELKQKFWEDPANLIKQMINESIAPIKESLYKATVETEYERLKRLFRNHPNHVLRDAVTNYEGYIDQLMSKVPPTEENMRAIIYGVLGAVSAGEIAAAPSSQLQQTQPQQEGKMTLPPHLRPSAPQVPEQKREKKYRDLTETERRIAKESGLTPEQYLEALEIPPDKVVEVDFNKLGAK